jgi:hypothetical protein
LDLLEPGGREKLGKNSMEELMMHLMKTDLKHSFCTCFKSKSLKDMLWV